MNTERLEEKKKEKNIVFLLGNKLNEPIKSIILERCVRETSSNLANSGSSTTIPHLSENLYKCIDFYYHYGQTEEMQKELDFQK